jgi:hypothetical protein
MNTDLIMDSIKSNLSFYDEMLKPAFLSNKEDPNYSVKLNMVRQALALKAEAESEKLNWDSAKLMLSMYSVKQAYCKNADDEYMFSLLTFKLGQELNIEINLAFAFAIKEIGSIYNRREMW